jgi:protein phosphatase 1 regulatory subunit 7
MIKHVGQILNEDGEWEEYVEEVEADKPPIAYTYMGSEACPIEPESEVVDFCMQYRIPKIEGLEECKTLKVSFLSYFVNRFRVLQKLGLRKNLVKKIENIEHCTELVELELYDNRITKIENLEPLSKLIILDLAFNAIKEVTPGCLDSLVNLKKLYLSANKIKKIQGLDKL